MASSWMWSTGCPLCQTNIFHILQRCLGFTPGFLLALNNHAPPVGWSIFSYIYTFQSNRLVVSSAYRRTIDLVVLARFLIDASVIVYEYLSFMLWFLRLKNFSWPSAVYHHLSLPEFWILISCDLFRIRIWLFHLTYRYPNSLPRCLMSNEVSPRIREIINHWSRNLEEIHVTLNR